MENKRTKWQKFYGMIVLGVFFLLMLCSILRLHEPLEFKVYDSFMSLKPHRTPHQDIIYLVVEEEVKNEGLWPWKENWLAYLVNYLSGIGVKTIVIDSSLSKFVSGVNHNPLVKAAQTRTAVLYPGPDTLESKDNDLILDRDNKVRRFVLFSQEKEKFIPSLVLSAALIYFGVGQENLNLIKDKKIEIRQDGAKKISIPLFFRGQALINYNKWTKADIKKYSYFDLAFSAFLNSRNETPTINFNDFRNKICFVGVCPLISKKTYLAPVKINCSSLEIRANMLDNILGNNFMRKLKPEQNLFVLLACVALSVFLFLKLNLLKRTVSLIALIVFYILGSFLVFSYLNIWIDTILPGLAIVTAFSGITIYRYGLERETRLNERRRELARQLKKETLAKNTFVTDKFEMFIKATSPKEAEGDFYDIIELDADRTAIVLGKTPGRNLRTVNYIIKILHEFRLQAPLHKRPRAVLNAVNNILFPDGAGAMFATCVYFEIDSSRGILSFANAGHEPLILVRQTVQDIEICEASNPTPLGVAKNVIFSDQTTQLKKGDLLIAFTHGIVEAKNKGGIEFGIERIKELINQYRSWDISKLANKVFEKIHRFSEGQDISSECTLLLLRIKAELKSNGALINQMKPELIERERT